MPRRPLLTDEERKRPARPGEGRPQLYKPEYCDVIIDDASKGYSFTASAGFIGVSKQTLKNWAAEYPEFRDAMGVAKALRCREWETMGIGIAKSGSGGPGASSMVMFALKNMGSDEWTDTSKHELTGPDGQPINVASTVVNISGNHSDL